MSKTVKRHAQHSNYCQHCGTLFNSSRFDAQYCSSACRTAEHREQKRRQAFDKKFQDTVASLFQEYLELHPSVRQGYSSIEQYALLDGMAKMLTWYVPSKSSMRWWRCTQCSTAINVSGVPYDKNCQCGLNSWKLSDTRS